MKKLEISTGQKYNMLTVVEELPSGPNGRVFKCKCDCGNDHKALLQHLVAFKIKSCGCHRRNVHTRHGMWQSREYSTWENMIQRCSNPKAKKYHLYGGRGIKVCERWAKSFISFYEDMGPRPDDTSLDRKDGDKGYCKENCKWSTYREQLSNIRFFTKTVSYCGVVKPTEEWIKELNLDRELFKSRILRGLGFKEALFCEVDIIYLDLVNKRQVISRLEQFLVDQKLEKNKVLELLDSDHEIPYLGLIVRYLTGFKGWPERYTQ